MHSIKVDCRMQSEKPKTAPLQDLSLLVQADYLWDSFLPQGAQPPYEFTIDAII